LWTPPDTALSVLRGVQDTRIAHVAVIGYWVIDSGKPCDGTFDYEIPVRLLAV
jgi:hypothetical protein